MANQVQNFVHQHNLILSLRPVFIGQLILLESLDNPAYGFYDGEFVAVIDEDEPISSGLVSEYAKKYGKEIFIHQRDFSRIEEQTRSELTKLSRSLSVGPIKKNALKQTNLLSMQMENLYRNPFDDNILTTQFQSSKNLSGLLLNNRELPRDLFHNLSQSSYHYTIAQPLLSSIIYLSFIQSLGGFNEKEIQNLFLTSYFKDIGMSLIPKELFEKEILTEAEKKLFSNHANSSQEILDQRIPLSEAYLNMIKNHHHLNEKVFSLLQKELPSNSSEFMTGIESTLMSSLDILVAMTHERPYRKAVSPFEALELLKKLLSDEYPQEFKALVIFLKKFYSL
tara:strand:+ start:1561 stop:2574 length:1014 start_codon:yes stop_codon:yes gene_type:complete